MSFLMHGHVSVNIFLLVKHNIQGILHIYSCYLLKSNRILKIWIIITDDTTDISAALTANMVQLSTKRAGSEYMA